LSENIPPHDAEHAADSRTLALQVEALQAQLEEQTKLARDQVCLLKTFVVSLRCSNRVFLANIRCSKLEDDCVSWTHIYPCWLSVTAKVRMNR